MGGRSFSMTNGLGRVLLITMLFASVATTRSLAVASETEVRKLQATPADDSVRRHNRRMAHYVYRPYYPYYYGRPFYYSPGPFFLPVPSLWGYGWQWW
jgi:hypothetical protein